MPSLLGCTDADRPRVGAILESYGGKLYRVTGVYPLYLRGERCRADGLDVNEGRGTSHWLKSWKRVLRG